ncbi:hypothetical protein [Streptomyces goshikiensis]|uniref:hypothetical protein n=2 Tax=Streptomyces TaxID=1883 RepID=UPI0036C7EB1B
MTTTELRLNSAARRQRSGGGPLPPAAPSEQVDPARIGRRVVRRRAKGMDAGAVAAALEDARFDARQASRYEDLADEVRGPAELAEWERIAELLAAAVPGTVYDPDVDDVLQAELATDAAAVAREAELREAARIAARADQLQQLRGLGTLGQAEPAEGDEAVRDELTRRAGGYVQADVDSWLAHALAAHGGHYRDPAAREAAASLLTPPVLAHAALLGELVRLVPGAGADELAFAARLATTEPEAVGASPRSSSAPAQRATDPGGTRLQMPGAREHGRTATEVDSRRPRLATNCILTSMAGGTMDRHGLTAHERVRTQRAAWHQSPHANPSEGGS